MMHHLQVVLEHITTRDAADFVMAGPDTLAATVTPQHVLMNRNALFLVPLISTTWQERTYAIHLQMTWRVCLTASCLISCL